MTLVMKLLLFSAFLTLGGALMALKSLPGLLSAQASGVTRRRGHNNVRISREAEPERFDNLMRQRWREVLIYGVIGLSSLPFTIFLAIAEWRLLEGPA